MSISLTISPSKHHFFQTDNQKAVLYTMFSLLELSFSCYIDVAVAKDPTSNDGYCFARKLTLFCIELPENCIYLNQLELRIFFLHIINYVNSY